MNDMKEQKTLKDLFYSGELNTKRIKAYKMLSQNYTIEEGKCRDIFSHGIEFACDEVKEYSDQQNAELLAWKESAMRVLNALDLQSLGRKLGIGLGQSVSENLHAKVDGLLERVKELESQLTKYRKALEDVIIRLGEDKRFNALSIAKEVLNRR